MKSRQENKPTKACDFKIQALNNIIEFCLQLEFDDFITKLNPVDRNYQSIYRYIKHLKQSDNRIDFIINSDNSTKIYRGNDQAFAFNQYFNSVFNENKDLDEEFYNYINNISVSHSLNNIKAMDNFTCSYQEISNAIDKQKLNYSCNGVISVSFIKMFKK